MAKKLIGLYPGTFDPATLGHVDIIKRAVKIVDHLVIGIVAANDSKKQMFSLKERVDMMRHEAEPLAEARATIEVKTYDMLQVKFAHEVGATIVIRGLRAVSDFDYEFQLAGMNRNLFPEVESIFLTPAEQFLFISATLVREISVLGGDVGKFVSPHVEQCLKDKIKSLGGKA